MQLVKVVFIAFQEHNGKDPDCMAMWFSNGVRIPGKATLGEKFSQPEVK